MSRPPEERSKAREGEGGASDDIRIAIKGVEVGGEDMNEIEKMEVEQDVAEAEVGGGVCVCLHWMPQGS